MNGSAYLTGLTILLALVAALTVPPTELRAQETPEGQIVTIPVSGMT